MYRMRDGQILGKTNIQNLEKEAGELAQLVQWVNELAVRTDNLG